MNIVRSVYLAARFSKQEQLREYRDLFVKKGILVTSTWLDQDVVTNLGGPGEKHELNTRFAIQDLVDVRLADGLVFFSEPELARRGGRHVEYGYALALGKPIYVVGGKENIFHYTPGIRHFGSVDEVLQDITLTNFYLDEMGKGNKQ